MTVIAHENVKKRMLEGSTNGLTGAHTAGPPPDAVPTKTYTGNTGPTLKVKGRTAKIGHIANAHTDGDSYVYFPEVNILATGDVVVLGRYPNIDFANGGSIKGMIAASTNTSKWPTTKRRSCRAMARLRISQISSLIAPS